MAGTSQPQLKAITTCRVGRTRGNSVTGSQGEEEREGRAALEAAVAAGGCQAGREEDTVLRICWGCLQTRPAWPPAGPLQRLTAGVCLGGRGGVTVVVGGGVRGEQAEREGVCCIWGRRGEAIDRCAGCLSEGTYLKCKWKEALWFLKT